MRHRKRNYATILISALLLLATIFNTSCQKSKESDAEKNYEPSNQGVRVEYHPKPAAKDSALSFRVYLPYDAKKVVLELLPNGKKEGKEILLKKISPREFAGIVIAFEDGVYRLRLTVTDENQEVKKLEKGLPVVHVISKGEKSPDDMDLIVEYLKDYHSLLPSSYREIRIIESEVAERKGKRLLYRVIFEARKYEEGRLRETETMFFVINREAGLPYIEYAEKDPPPDFD